MIRIAAAETQGWLVDTNRHDTFRFAVRVEEEKEHPFTAEYEIVVQVHGHVRVSPKLRIVDGSTSTAPTQSNTASKTTTKRPSLPDMRMNRTDPNDTCFFATEPVRVDEREAVIEWRIPPTMSLPPSYADGEHVSYWYAVTAWATNADSREQSVAHLRLQVLSNGGDFVVDAGEKTHVVVPVVRSICSTENVQRDEATMTPLRMPPPVIDDRPANDTFASEDFNWTKAAYNMRDPASKQTLGRIRLARKRHDSDALCGELLFDGTSLVPRVTVRLIRRERMRKELSMNVFHPTSEKTYAEATLVTARALRCPFKLAVPSEILRGPPHFETSIVVVDWVVRLSLVVRVDGDGDDDDEAAERVFEWSFPLSAESSGGRVRSNLGNRYGRRRLPAHTASTSTTQQHYADAFYCPTRRESRSRPIQHA